jgi:hypothetical protein
VLDQPRRISKVPQIDRAAATTIAAVRETVMTDNATHDFALIAAIELKKQQGRPSIT